MTFGLALDFWSPATPLSKQLDDYVTLLELAERYGFDSVWAGEGHLQMPAPNHVPSPLLVLSSLARSTRLKLGTGVLLLPLWHPLRLAHEAALLDNISDGRLVLGVSVGHPFLMARYGIPPQQMSSRMDESLSVLKRFWRGADEHAGKHFTISGCVYPAPVQDGGPPLWIGGNIYRSIERAAAWGDAWYGATEYHAAVIQRRSRQFRELVSQQWGDASRKTVCINRLTMLAETDERARKEVKPYLDPLLNFYKGIDHLKDQNNVSLDPVKDFDRFAGEEFCLIGSPESSLHKMVRYCEDAGVNHINFRVRFSDIPLELTRRTITLLGEEVLPAFGNT